MGCRHLCAPARPTPHGRNVKRLLNALQHALRKVSPISVMMLAHAPLSVLAPARQGVHPGRLVVNKPDLALAAEPRQPAACTCPPPGCSLHCSPQPRQPRCRRAQNRTAA